MSRSSTAPRRGSAQSVVCASNKDPQQRVHQRHIDRAEDDAEQHIAETDAKDRHEGQHQERRHRRSGDEPLPVEVQQIVRGGRQLNQIDVTVQQRVREIDVVRCE